MKGSSGDGESRFDDVGIRGSRNAASSSAEEEGS